MAQPEQYGIGGGFFGKGFGVLFLIILLLLCFPFFCGGFGAY